MRVVLFVILICLNLKLIYSACAGLNHCVKSNDSAEFYSDYMNYIKLNSIVYGVAKVADDTNNIGEQPNDCVNHLITVKTGIEQREVWAVKILDASGQPNAGFMLGNNFWLGSTEQCSYINRPVSVHISERFNRNMKSNMFTSIAPFPTEMKIIYAAHESPWQVQFKVMTENVLHIGLCLPKSCTNDQVKNLAEIYFSKTGTGFQNAYDVEPHILEVKNFKFDTRFFFKKSVILLFAVISFVIFVNHMSKDLPNLETDGNNNDLTDTCQGTGNLKRNVIRSFNFKDNKQLILSSGIDKSAINSIAGLRSISCFLIFISHICTFIHFTMPNTLSFIEGSERLSGQILLMSSLLVDGFFAISGFLAAYKFLNDAQQLNKIKSNGFWENLKVFLKIIFHRYIRLTPVMIISMLLAEIVASYLNNFTPYTIYFRDDLNCQHYWWRNLFYIHSFFPQPMMCLEWAWSLGCDMQFFAVTTIILFIYAKNPLNGEKLLKVSLAIFTIISIIIHIYHKFTLSIDVMHSLLSAVYTVPWTRANPYLLGTMSAIYLRKNNYCPNIAQMTQIKLWILCGISICSIMLGQKFKTVHYIVASLLKVAAHTEIGLIFCWIIIADKAGYRNSFIKFLSKRMFIRYDKTTYALYLIGPLVTLLVYGSLQHGANYDFPEIVIMIYIIKKLSGRIAFLITAFFEIPFCRISKIILQHQKLTTKLK